MSHPLPEVIEDEFHKVRIVVKKRTFNDMFQTCLFPIWNYGQADSYIRRAMTNILDQLIKLDIEAAHREIMEEMFLKMNVVIP